ncbi:MAG: ABC transporter ATP-binding protein [Pseudoprimorskyibacter sp.]|nr:ABC transporter ATP-binding protein [Pseudoprimorskyibacter sp.]
MLSVNHLTVEFPSRLGDTIAIEDVALSIEAGEIHGLVGESGAGKSTVGAAIIGLLQAPGFISEGRMLLDDTDLRSLSPLEAHRLRGKRISMIFQDPQTSLNPLMKIEDQLIETIQAHEDISSNEARTRAVDLLEEIGIQNASNRISAYPHQFSGGMRQRVVIALALCTNPDLIIADEPTTALDVAVQSQVLALIKNLAKSRRIGFLLITHDIGVIAQIADRVSVMRYGKVLETGETGQVLNSPRHSYTRALLDAVPPLDHKISRFLVPTDQKRKDNDNNKKRAETWLLAGGQTNSVGLEIEGLRIEFVGSRTSVWRKPKPFTALHDISIKVQPGSIMGLVGESGSGKSTLAKAITGLVTPAAGRMFLASESLPYGNSRGREHISRRIIQMIFQDPYSSLNSRHSIGTILSEPLWLYGLVHTTEERQKLAASMLDLVGLAPSALDKYPHQFSGGQRQRIAIARALLARPKFLICDEPTSALDVSIQAEILNLLKDLQTKFGLTILFISHNLAVVRQMSDDLVVLRNGSIKEAGPSQCVFENPRSDYMKELLSLTPVLETQRVTN